VKEYEKQEPLVVFGTNTLINPDAVVVKLLDAMVADSAVFGSRRLVYLACFALVLFGVHYIIEDVLLHHLFSLLLVLDNSWVNCTRHVEAKVTC